MTAGKPNYHYEDVEGRLTRSELEMVLDKIPIGVEVTKGHDLVTYSRIEENSKDHTLRVKHYAGVISLKPPEGFRLSDASFFGPRGLFQPSRIMDECTGGGACCSYSFNTKDLGMPFDEDLMLDIYKLG